MLVLFLHPSNTELNRIKVNINRDFWFLEGASNAWDERWLDDRFLEIHSHLRVGDVRNAHAGNARWHNFGGSLEVDDLGGLVDESLRNLNLRDSFIVKFDRKCKLHCGVIWVGRIALLNCTVWVQFVHCHKRDFIGRHCADYWRTKSHRRSVRLGEAKVVIGWRTLHAISVDDLKFAQMHFAFWRELDNKLIIVSTIHHCVEVVLGVLSFKILLLVFLRKGVRLISRMTGFVPTLVAWLGSLLWTSMRQYWGFLNSLFEVLG